MTRFPDGGSMPLHDWSNDAGWDGFHLLWIGHLFHAIKPRLPDDFRAYLGSIPTLSVAIASKRPDGGVRHWLAEPPAEIPGVARSEANRASPNGGAACDEPDVETATITLDPQKALYVTYRGRLAAAVELISPRQQGSAHVARLLSVPLSGVLKG